jgi:drug/metabolite transporter (DMT)-like permease
MIAAYGIANLLQSMAATKTATTDNLDPGLLLRLFGNRTYLLGLLCQIFGFFFALAARRDLPLFLVQSAVTAGLCVTALLGVIILKWRLPPAEIALLTLVVIGIGALAASAEPSKGEQLGIRGIITLIVALAVIAVGSTFAGRIKGVLGSVVLGSIAGLCFSSAAIAARPLAGAHSVAEFLLNPLLYLVIAHSLTGQLLLGLAMQRGSTNAAVAGMDAAGAVPAAVIGLVLLGDQMRPGLEWLAVIGFVVTLGAVIALTRYAEPQHELVAEPAPLPFRYRSASVPGLPEHPARGVVEVPEAIPVCRTHVTIALQRPIPRTATGSAAAVTANGHTIATTVTTPGYATHPTNGHPALPPNGHTALPPNGHPLQPANGHTPHQANGHQVTQPPTNGQAATNNGHAATANGQANGLANSVEIHPRRPSPAIVD